MSKGSFSLKTVKSICSKGITFLVDHDKISLMVLCFLSLAPIFTSTYFITLDGPSHLYNAKLIGSLLTENNSTVGEFFALNSFMPNSFGHGLLALFMTFSPPFIAEKILVAIYIFLFVFSFRYLIRSANGNVLFTYLIFPFAYSFPFLLGFYNFSFGLVFLFFTLGFWIKNNQESTNPKFVISLVILLFLTFSSHLVIFGLLLFFILISILHNLLFEKSKSLNDRLSKPVIVLFIASIVPLYFTLQYFLNRPISKSNFIYLNKFDLFLELINLRPIIGFNIGKEVIFTRLIGLVIAVLAFYAIYQLITKKKTGHSESQTAIIHTPANYFWGSLILILLGLYFLFPDSDGRGSYLNLRFGLLLYPFLLVWLSRVIYKKTILIPAALVVLAAHISLVAQYSKVGIDMSPIITEITETANFIPESSVVVVAKVTDNWLLGHYSNYIGLENPIVILDNYEANYGYFPVTWNEESFPNIKLFDTTFPADNCMQIKTNKEGDNYPADFLFILGNYENLSHKCPEWAEIIQKSGRKSVYSAPHATLIKLKN